VKRNDTGATQSHGNTANNVCLCLPRVFSLHSPPVTFFGNESCTICDLTSSSVCSSLIHHLKYVLTCFVARSSFFSISSTCSLSISSSDSVQVSPLINDTPCQHLLLSHDIDISHFCLSVCLSVQCWCYVETPLHIAIFTIRWGPRSNFCAQTPLQNSEGNIFNEALNAFFDNIADCLG